MLNTLGVCGDYVLVDFLVMFKKAYVMIEVVAPIIAIVSLAIIFTRYVANPEDKKLSGTIKNLVISLVVVFMLPVLINAAMGLLDSTMNFEFASCWKEATLKSVFDFDKDDTGEDVHPDKPLFDK